MKQIISKPHFILFAASAALLLVSWLFFQRSAMDIHLHDTYFVIDNQTYFTGLALTLALLGGLYMLCARALTLRWLIWLHVAITVLAIIATIILTLLQPMPDRDPGYSEWINFDQYVAYSRWYVIALMAFVGVQILFLINIAIGIFKIIKK